MRNASGHQGEQQGEQERGSFGKFHVVVVKTTAKKWTKKSVLQVCFTVLVAFAALALHDFIFCLSKLEILSRASLLALAKSI